MRLRPATEADRAAVLALGVAEEAAWFGEPEVSAEEVGEWVDAEGWPGVVVEQDGCVRGYAARGPGDLVYLADPEATDAVADVLLPHLLESGRVDILIFGDDAERQAAFERHGLRHRKSSFTLARPAGAIAEPAFPPGVVVAPYRLGDDDAAVHRLVHVDAAWASVPGHSERGLESWQEVMRPCGVMFLARRDGRPVGWLAARVQANGRGYVQQLAVAAGERGRGLGRALLLHGFAALLAEGATDLGLGVEAENAGALNLYRSVGLEVEREWRTLTK